MRVRDRALFKPRVGIGNGCGNALEFVRGAFEIALDLFASAFGALFFGVRFELFRRCFFKLRLASVNVRTALVPAVIHTAAHGANVAVAKLRADSRGVRTRLRAHKRRFALVFRRSCGGTARGYFFYFDCVSLDTRGSGIDGAF